MNRLPLRFAFLVSLLSPCAAEPAALPAQVEYNRDIRPILAENCFKCHGFDKGARKAGLRLDTAEGAMKEDPDGVRALVPGKLADSEAHQRIHSSDPDEIMPPPKSEKKLSPHQILLLDRWIEQGAKYQAHWAYIAPAQAPPPDVSDSAFTRTPIDRFVLAHLQESGLVHASEADKPTLCRRLYLDLLGLPPTPQEVDAFVEDHSAESYEKLVDHLLASPHFGERLAVTWLDLVRYADSIGYHSDNPRNVWPYRDWVINAFNENKRFDQFTIEQVAGDLLPNASQEQRVASAFNRLNMTTEEGGAQAKEYEAKTVTDRVKAIGVAWLAQTVMCAECHDHKYDPILTRDFYSLGAFFADIKESAIGGREPGMVVATPEEVARLKENGERVAALEQQLRTPSPQLQEAQAAWEKQLAAGSHELPWSPLAPVAAVSDGGAHFAIRPDQSIHVEAAGNPPSDTYRLTVRLPAGATGIRLEALPHASLPAKGPGRAINGNFVLNELTVESKGQPLKLSKGTATFEQPKYAASQAIDGISDKKDNGWAVDGHEGQPATAYFQLAKALPQQETEVTIALLQHYGENHTLGEFRLSATTAPPPVEAPNSGLPPDVAAALAVAPEQRTPAQRETIAAHFRSVAPDLAPLRAQIADLGKARTALESSLGRCLVTEHTDQLRTVRILPRGDWQNDKGEVVSPAVPHFLPQPHVPDGRKLTRLDLGQWLVSRENPLTARVFVNRLWKLYFGVGLCKSVEDLGTQGEVPALQPLLDYLACEFMESGWDVKHMVRLMVLSGAYRQSSACPKDLLLRDPNNRELARQSRFRLDAEFVRDNALAISGLLVPKLGGPSVKPYQPAGYWENLNFPAREWQADKDENQWRRGIYTWWQRSYLHPSLQAFDAPSREECTAERLRSNIPQQALALLNDPTYVEAARAFAQRIVREGGASSEQRIAWAWREATLRPPLPAESRTLQRLFEKHLALFTQDPDAARQLVSIGNAPPPREALPEIAAWTSVARAILNLHETITRL